MLLFLFFFASFIGYHRYVVKFHWLVSLLHVNLTDYKLLVIETVKSDSFGVAIAKLSSINIGC